MDELKIGVVKFGPPGPGKETEATWGTKATRDLPPNRPSTDREGFIAAAYCDVDDALTVLKKMGAEGAAVEHLERAKVYLVRAGEAYDGDPKRVTIWPEEPDRKPRHYDLREVPDEDAAGICAEPGTLYEAVPAKEE